MATRKVAAFSLVADSERVEECRELFTGRWGDWGEFRRGMHDSAWRYSWRFCWTLQLLFLVARWRDQSEEEVDRAVYFLWTFINEHANSNLICIFCVYRSSQFWEKIVLETFGPINWIENFRMSRETFGFLCEKLRPRISRQSTRLRRAISTEKRVAITLWCLATPSEYRTIAHMFGVGRSTVCTIVQETCRVIVSRLMNTYIRFTCGHDLQEAVQNFETKWGLPQCAGAIDGSHNYTY